MHCFKLSLLVLAGSCGFVPVAGAQSLTGNVGSAAIAAGERAVESRFGINDEGDAAARVHFDYAFSGWYQLRTIASFTQPDGKDWEASGLTFENWLQWREEARDSAGFNGGVRLAYTFEDGGGPDEAEVRLTITDKFADRWEWRANIIGEIETGNGSEGGVSVDTRAQLTRAVKLADSFETRLGVELLSELGDTRDFPTLEDQAHQFGPVLKAEWGEGFYLQTAARFGLTNATDDAMIKLFVGREF